MVVEYPDHRCELSPTRAHYYVKLVGSIWRCHYCWAAVWLPSDWSEATKFSADVGRMGIEVAYQKYLRHRPKTRQLLGKLEDIRLLRKVVPQEQLMIAIAAIITVKESELEDVEAPANPDTRDIDLGDIAKEVFVD